MMSKMVKKDQKTKFFGLFKKIKSFFLSGIVVKQKLFMVFYHSAKTAYLGKICFSSYYGQKWLTAKDISIFFNFQYFINRLISDFDVWNVDRHE